MSQISVFAQPGLAFMGAEQAARENRLATAQQQAAQAAAEAQQRLRQQAFTSLQGAPDAQANPQAMAAQLAAAGDTEGARLALSMGTAQEARQTRQESRQERQETRQRSLLDRAAQRVLSAPDQEAQLPQTARALAEELEIPIAEARERLQREMQIAAAPRDREIDALIRGSGIDPNSPQGQETYRAVLRRRIEGNAPTVNVAPTDVAGIVEALGAQGVRALAQGELQNTVQTATNAISVITLVDQFETAVEAAGGRGVAGVLGELRSAGTGLVGMAQTLGSLGPEGQRLNEFVNAQVADARGSLDQETFNSLFGNPELGAVQLLGSALNYSNARLRHGAGPLSNQDVQRNSVVRGGLQSDGELFAALRAVRRNAEEEYERANARNESILENPYNALRVPPRPQRRTPGQPASTAPATPRQGVVPEGVDPADWEFMTPAERALWDD